MGMQVGGGGDYASEINITPLVDVVLVLLIIFMVIVPVMMRGYDMEIPGEAVAAPEQRHDERPEQVVMTVEMASCPVTEPVRAPEAEPAAAMAGLPEGCTVHLNDDEIAVADLPGRIGETFGERQREDRVLFLAADDTLNYEGVMRILDVAKSGVEGLRVGVVMGE